MRILALNLNHRTIPGSIDPTLLNAIAISDPDVLVFNEYVDIGVAQRLKRLLMAAGYTYQAISESIEYRRGRWHNQVLIASKEPIENAVTPQGGPYSMCSTNTLTVTTLGVRITGIRIPAFTNAGQWYPYWEWTNKSLEGDIAIGDFNVDPSRQRKWDRVLTTLVSLGDWERPEITGDWSYRGHNGSTSCVDHVLVRNGITVLQARYESDAFVPSHTDHAALIVDVTRSRDTDCPE